jgi:hypothetical protein
MENIISIGLRYGFSTFNQELNSYKIYNANPYFGNCACRIREQIGRTTASWIEVVAGLKAKYLIKYFFIEVQPTLNRLVSIKAREF